ncbi:hypothetical protein HA402_002666 [Bradysia odoriphaga]|nr:hypothetical protein HA402_002666 [Bradysia odoriphaga]
MQEKITDDDDDMPNASDDNISQEDTNESNEPNDWNGFNASSAVSEQASYADTLEEMVEEPQRAIANSDQKSSLFRRSEREASKRAREAIGKLFKNILQRTRNLKAESTEDDESSDWRQGQFAWIKFTERSKNLPGFVLPAMHGIRKAKTITLKGVLSLYKFVIYRSDPRIDDSLKDERYKRALADFNSRNDCKFR